MKVFVEYCHPSDPETIKKNITQSISNLIFGGGGGGGVLPRNRLMAMPLDGVAFSRLD